MGGWRPVHHEQDKPRRKTIGYTHYFQQGRDFSLDSWKQVREDIAVILNHTQHVQGVPLANGNGEPGTQPQIDGNEISLNGVGPNNNHESFCVYRKRKPLESWQSPSERGWGFTKTAQKPYDIAVVACLAYLESIHPAQFERVSSDGDGHDWLAGVELAKAALPRYANQIDIPLAIRKADRWDYRASGGIQVLTEKYQVGFCINGKAYVFDPNDESKSYCFPSHSEALEFFGQLVEERKGGKLFYASGSFDQRRIQKIGTAQTKICRALIFNAGSSARAKRPPAFVRPNVMAPELREKATLADLFSMAP